MTRESLLRIEGNGCGVEIRVTRGALWITQENDAEDHVLTSGAVFTIRRRGILIICALEDADVIISLNSFQQKFEMALSRTYSDGECWSLR